MKTSKIGNTYASVLFDISVEKNILHQIAADFTNLTKVLNQSAELKDFLTNPIIKKNQKRGVLTKILKKQVNTSTFNFLMLLIDRNIINYLPEIMSIFFALLEKAGNVLTFEISTASELTFRQKWRLKRTLKKLTGAKTVKLIPTVDPSLIGGFLIKQDSKIMDLTAKNELKQLAKFLNVPFYF